MEGDDGQQALGVSGTCLGVSRAILGTLNVQPLWQAWCGLGGKDKKKFGTYLDLCVSSLRRGHANLLCIVPVSEMTKKGGVRVSMPAPTEKNFKRNAPILSGDLSIVM